MKKVNRGSLATPDAVKRKVAELCDGTQQCTEEIADAYTLTLPSNFTPVRSLDLTSALTVDMLGAVFATFIQDMQQRGAGRRTSSV